MRNRLRISLTLALPLALVAPGAQAINIKNICEGLGVTLGIGSVIESGQVAVPQRFHRKVERFLLYLDVTENRISGDDIFLGSQLRRLVGTALVSSDGGPNGRALYDAAWNTDPLFTGSSVTVCAQVFRLSGRAASSLECRNFDPTIP